MFFGPASVKNYINMLSNVFNGTISVFNMFLQFFNSDLFGKM